MTSIAVRQVTARYNGRPVLAGIDLRVDPGEWLMVVGPNGAGKTTLVRVLSGAVAFGGDVEIGERPIQSLKRRQLAAEVGVVPQTPVVPDGVTVHDYVLLGRTPYIPYWRIEGPQDRDRVATELARLDLAGMADRPLTSLSGGERQRAVLARALAQDASVLLLDEPTTALDLGHQQQVLELVDELRRERDLVVISTLHDLTFAAQYGDRIMLLVDGSVVAEGHPSAVLTVDRVAAHFDATVRIVDTPTGPMVVPIRSQPGKLDGR